MKPISRRASIGMGSASTFGVILAHGSTAYSATAQQHAHASAQPIQDPVLAQIGAELARIYKATKPLGARSEHVRAVASTNRLLLAHAAAIGLDDQFRDAIGKAVDTNGRDAVLAREFDRDHMAREWRTNTESTSPLISPEGFPRRWNRVNGS